MSEPIPKISDLRKISQKPLQFETVAYARYFIRKISIYITWVVVHFPITANQVTVAQAVFGLAGSALLAFGGRDWAVLALALIQFGYILDCVDGEVARYRKASSVNGVFLDNLNHVIVIPSIFWGTVLYSYLIHDNIIIIIAGIIVSILVANPVKKANLNTLFNLKDKGENPQYDISALQGEKNVTNKQLEKIDKKNKFVLWAQAIADYPASMNILAIAILLDLLWPNQALIPSLLIYFYTFYLLARESVMLLITLKTHKIEKKFNRFFGQ